MQRLEVSGAVRLIYKSLGVKGLKYFSNWTEQTGLQTEYGLTVEARVLRFNFSSSCCG